MAPGDAPDEFRCRVLHDAATVARDLRGAGRKYLKAGAQNPLKALLEERESEDELQDTDR